MGYTVFLAGNKKGKFLAYADAFYETYKEELVEFEATLNKNIPTFISLLNRLAKKKKKYVLVVSHGWTDGLWLPLYKGTKEESTTVHLASIYLMSKMRSTVEKLVDDKKPDTWFSSAANIKATMAKLKEVFPPHEFKYTDEKAAYAAATAVKTGGVSPQVTQIQNNVNTLSNNPQQLAKLGKGVQGIVDQWWNSLLVSSGLGDDKTANQYFKAMRSLQKVGIKRVEIRGCMIGKSKPSSQMLRIFLGADKLRAPTAVMVTQRVTPKIEKKVTVVKDEHVWNVGNGYVKWDPTEVYRISSLADWKKWIGAKIGRSRKTVGLTMPLMHLDTKPPVYPQDSGFAKLLNTYP